MSVATISIAFFTALAVLLLGVPIAVVLAGAGVVGGLATAGWPIIESLGSVIWSVQNDNLLTAIPLFILLGEILLRSGLADQMFVSLSAWLGRLPGGLLHSNIASCALFSASCGSSVATAATVGTVALPALNARGYSRFQSLGSLAAGGTLGILIPPSVALLVYGSITNNSIGRLFVAGVLPGILLTLCFMTYIVLANRGARRGDMEAKLSFRQRVVLSRHLLPPAIIFSVVMGSLYFGLATPTESASLGVLIAIGCAMVVGRFDLAILHHCFKETAALTGMIILIISGSFILNVTLNFLNVPQTLTQLVVTLGLGPTEFILVLVVFYLMLGCFLEVLSIQVTTIPIAYPIVTALGVDPIWFGIFVVLMSEIAMITPPVGMNLYVVQSIRRDGGPMSEVVIGVLPYVAIMLTFTIVIWLFPEIVLWLPRNMF